MIVDKNVVCSGVKLSKLLGGTGDTKIIGVIIIRWILERRNRKSSFLSTTLNKSTIWDIVCRNSLKNIVIVFLLL